MSSKLVYNRNWFYECNGDVQMEDGTWKKGYIQQERGRILKMEVDDEWLRPEDFKEAGIAYVHFDTPAKLTVK